MNFATQHEDILNLLHSFNPVEYSKTRNYIDGNVSYLSPYISRGILSTKKVMEHILSLGYPRQKTEKFIEELAWRDYWQNSWRFIKNIDEDIKQNQKDVDHFYIPKSVRFGLTGIKAIDNAITGLKKEGYMHNHVRMYVASLCCNFGHSHWLTPAKWMFYHLYDGDWASNALSWQWVAGANSSKKYVFNQENVNTFCKTSQEDTYLDLPYESIDLKGTPKKLIELDKINLKTNLPDRKSPILRHKKVNLFTYYNMDPEWHQNSDTDNVLLLEPSLFEKYPISDNVLDFTLQLAKNIKNINFFFGEFDELKNKYPNKEFHFKEHPTNQHFSGTMHERDWMFNVQRYYPSFFSFWKKCKATKGWKKK